MEEERKKTPHKSKRYAEMISKCESSIYCLTPTSRKRKWTQTSVYKRMGLFYFPCPSRKDRLNDEIIRLQCGRYLKSLCY